MKLLNYFFIFWVTFVWVQNVGAYSALKREGNRSSWPKLPLTFNLNSSNSGLDETELKTGISQILSMWGQVPGSAFKISNQIGVSTADAWVAMGIDQAAKSYSENPFDGENSIVFEPDFANLIKTKAALNGDTSADPNLALIIAVGGQLSAVDRSKVEAFLIMNVQNYAFTLNTDAARAYQIKSFTDVNNGTEKPVFDLLTVAAHELGHSFGLGHSSDASAIMKPSVPLRHIRRNLGRDDVYGIRAIYPARDLLWGASCASVNGLSTRLNGVDVSAADEHFLRLLSFILSLLGLFLLLQKLVVKKHPV